MFKFILIILLSLSSLALQAKIIKQSNSKTQYDLVLRLQRGKYVSIKLNKDISQIDHLKFYSSKRKITRRNKRYLKRLKKLKNQPKEYYQTLEALLSLPTSQKFSEAAIISEHSLKKFNNICHLKGKKHLGSYTYKKKRYEFETIVGSKDNGCMGMCGKDCLSVGKPIYTQECFDHDLCHRKTKSFFGCFDELVSAMHGFFFGTRCR